MVKYTKFNYIKRRPKVGDKVIIKTQEEFKKEFGQKSHSLSFSFNLNNDDDLYRFTKYMENKIEALYPDRVLTVLYVNDRTCIMEGFNSSIIWEEWMIKGRHIERYSIEESVNSRFEMLDL